MSNKDLLITKLKQQLVECDGQLFLLKDKALQNKINNEVNLSLCDQIEKLQRKLDEGKKTGKTSAYNRRELANSEKRG